MPDCPANPLTDPYCALLELGRLLGAAMYGMTAFAGLASLFFLIVGGFKYITAGDNPKELSAARSTLTWAIIGFIVAASAYALVRFFVKFGGGIPGLTSSVSIPIIKLS
ncbi:MAG: hypothetical protein FJ044_00245 [Candidatus Cloacimonetes bacterium]|nr:hypothetical protein [Candidatus Cloacimonadota bacterium]